MSTRDMAERWVYAEVIGVGPLAFLTSDAVGDEDGIIRARQLTSVRIEARPGMPRRVSIEKCFGYDAGVLQDPVLIPVRSCSFVCVATKKLAEHAAEAWSPIAKPNGKQVRDLGGRG